MNADGDVTPDRSCCHTSMSDALGTAPCTITPSGLLRLQPPISVLGNGAHLQTDAIAEGYVRDGELLQAATMLSKLYVGDLFCFHVPTERHNQVVPRATGERSRQPIATSAPEQRSQYQEKCGAPRRWRISES